MKRLLSLALMVLAALPIALPAGAAQADVELLKSYVGEWRGRGTAMFAATGQNETVVCRMSVSDSDLTKVAIEGRCTLAGRTLAIAGTVAFVETANRYEAIMSSVASFQGVAIGQRRGSDIAFNLVDRNHERGEHRIDADLSLRGSEIHLDFKITHVASGASTTARIPFVAQ
ncbi:hypothetical protein [Pelagibacterium limicola]|uniref:hypothetical protein n=1 Tax=Pelagibacterium limicola TaxID=2791022 RepID=UPI0018B0008C|nr:hypothetical protein [Pelagibacterium limicola]